MNTSRIQEIILSKQTIPVTFEGANVWIETINEQKETATVHPVGEENQKLQVPIERLHEQMISD